MKNNLKNKITVKKIWVQRNSTHQVNPYVCDFKDSIILQPFEQKTYTYSSYMLNMYFNDLSFFFSSFELDPSNPLKPQIRFYIDYVTEDSKEIIHCNVNLFLTINNLINYSAYFDTITKIDIQNLKKQAYLINTGMINCDSTTGTIIEDRICANLELQKQDSLLQLELDNLIKELQTVNDTGTIKKIKDTQEIWERYRYSHCNACIIDKTSSQITLFIKCATNLTIKRRDDIKKICEY